MYSGILNNLLGLLVIGALFYFVIHKVRTGGCCGRSDDRHNQPAQHCLEEPPINKKRMRSEYGATKTGME
jgi:hypothetical protein